jgi:hypothetical protein
MDTLKVRGTLFDASGEPIEVADFEVVEITLSEKELESIDPPRYGRPVVDGEIQEGYFVRFKEQL